ncbi:HflK protein [Oleidesulfovibrio alaskensis G20]|jgi:membrane protease subunit HflK|uniref:Protein HflK n=1 Tax=Oleidesulfovibrio alaskensis (strain ATCC BAA-1058 / DSM 17464 / G20) TaxID=207559 RepID=Q30X56_OLEA2|nr:FtsH protease activity modulator HflK [Oleidesulfovibrio alaskensis]ABB39740.1 HflK protein [Oleidesulfovibrio alaskensis G20]MBG0774696.1 FtsH protease activity modulator HflK [Oleidesulfovibrio alaskensis]MBL3582039.1 FtsH protease activity modulator HflK [Oleidesulfovibrio alaskensis]
MNWDWEKLQEKRQRQSGGTPPGNWGPKDPGSDPLGDGIKKLREFRFPVGKLALALLVLLWLFSGVFIVEPDEVGVVLRFGEYNRTVQPGPHYHMPFPMETAYTPKVSQVRRVEVGFRSSEGFSQGQLRPVKEESLMLTGDENIVDVQFIVQYQIKDPVAFLFNVSQQAWTVKSAAEAAMREVIGYNAIDSALTGGKLDIQNKSRDLLQGILDNYNAGVHVVAVQMQDVHPPKEVIDAFKDVASAREDRSRIINEAEAYQNEILPRARGLAAEIINQAEAYKETRIRDAKGESARFVNVLAEYNKAKDITRKRMYLETMETILSNPDLEKIILSGKAGGVVPYLPLDKLDADRARKGAQQ